MSLKRVDQLLFIFFPELSRSKIQSLIEKQKILFRNQTDDWMVVPKPGLKVNPSDFQKLDFQILEDDELLYVSRGALKLKGALEHFDIQVEGSLAMDVGISTGGFTDLLLKRGAVKVLGIDVGSDQLHQSLRHDDKLVWRDKINARDPLPQDLVEEFFGSNDRLFDIIVIDVSFISIKTILKPLVKYLKPEGRIVALVKPQFELTKSDINRQGVVRSSEKNQEALNSVIAFVASLGLKSHGSIPAAIQGDNGNQEYLLVIGLN